MAQNFPISKKLLSVLLAILMSVLFVNLVSAKNITLSYSGYSEEANPKAAAIKFGPDSPDSASDTLMFSFVGFNDADLSFTGATDKLEGLSRPLLYTSNLNGRIFEVQESSSCSAADFSSIGTVSAEIIVGQSYCVLSADAKKTAVVKVLELSDDWSFVKLDVSAGIFSPTVSEIPMSTVVSQPPALNVVSQPSDFPQISSEHQTNFGAVVLGSPWFYLILDLFLVIAIAVIGIKIYDSFHRKKSH